MKTYLIVPACSDQAGQCRIVSRNGIYEKALRDYRENPDAWDESGLMDSLGRLVCLDSDTLAAQMRDYEPLAAGGIYFLSEGA